jgi:Cu/Ag efflux pump CusA
LRRDLVIANPRPGDIDRFAASARSAIAHGVALPPGVFLEFQVVDDAARLQQRLEVAYALAAFAIFGLLALAFDARTAALAIGATLFSIIGAVIAVWMGHGVFSLGPMIGLVALAGFSMRSAILLISQTRTLVLERSAPWSFETVTRAARARAGPMIATALLVILALLPTALHGDAAGREIIGPMAGVIIGGLISATIGNLLLLPMLVFGFWRPEGPAVASPAPEPSEA